MGQVPPEGVSAKGRERSKRRMARAQEGSRTAPPPPPCDRRSHTEGSKDGRKRPDVSELQNNDVFRACEPNH
jgi:hypothetical protein